MLIIKKERGDTSLKYHPFPFDCVINLITVQLHVTNL